MDSRSSGVMTLPHWREEAFACGLTATSAFRNRNICCLLDNRNTLTGESASGGMLNIRYPPFAKQWRFMNREDFLRLAGGSKETGHDYLPVACMLASGYGCVGYFNSSINEGLDDTIVLLNARLVDLRQEDGHSRRGKVADFNDFLEVVVSTHYSRKGKNEDAEVDRDEQT
ncbi:MAG: hypothetical protein ACK50J_24015, partial [Planctomyces sp.]